MYPFVFTFAFSFLFMRLEVWDWSLDIMPFAGVMLDASTYVKELKRYDESHLGSSFPRLDAETHSASASLDCNLETV